jgi:hypothetical protein
MTVFGCHDPAGKTVGHDGWSVNRTADQDILISDTCSSDGRGSLGLELAANETGYQDAARAEWAFNAPAWGSISSYTLAVQDSYAIPSTSGGSGQAFIETSDESDPFYDFRNLGAGALGAYVIASTPGTALSWVHVNASCDGQRGTCPGSALVARMDVGAATLVLDDPTSPTVSALGGSLASSASLTGTGELSFSAADSGPGVYSAQLVIDGAPQTPVLLDANNGWCTNLGQTLDGTRSFAHPDPCLQSASGVVTLNTTTLHDGPHTIRLLVDDASGNATVGDDASINTRNAPAQITAPTITPSGRLSSGVGLTGAPGSWSAPAGAGSITLAFQWQRCDAAGAGCEDIPGAEGERYVLGAPDIGRALRILVTASDADGTTSALSGASSPVDTAAAGPPAKALANGTGASEHATVRLVGPRRVRRPLTGSALTLAGRLTGPGGAPVANASVDVLAQTAGGARRTVGELRTAGDGTFMAHVGRGPSRVLSVAYRAFSSDEGYASVAAVSETVAAQVTLTVSPQQTSPVGEVTLAGRVAGPLGKEGAIVVLLVRYRGHWEPFRTPRSDAHGRFRVSYRFQGALGSFPFRAEVPAGQAGLPYGSGYSPPVSVRTG